MCVKVFRKCKNSTEKSAGKETAPGKRHRRLKVKVAGEGAVCFTWLMSGSL
jgi:hypothetical protein